MLFGKIPARKVLIIRKYNGLCFFDEQFGWVNTVVLAAKMCVDRDQMNSNGEHVRQYEY